MSTVAVFTSIHKISFSYKQKLANIPSENFQQDPGSGGWSYSEVYNHIFDLSILSLHELEKCLSGKGKKRSTPLITKLILFFGALPPAIRFKVPNLLASRVKKCSKAEAETMITEFLVQLQPFGNKLEKANADIKTPHPKLGFLNGSQWLRFIEIHLKHHLKQLKRIDRSF
jgi:hypothetical protein